MVKMVKVKSKISVEVSPGYTIVGKFNILPKLLEFKGPKEIIENLDFFETISKKFKSVKAPINAKVPVSFNFTRVIESSDSLITFQANIQSIGERILSEIPVKILNIPVVEVHISNPFKRESFRQISFISSVATGIVSGFGTDVYKIAIQALALKIGN